MVDKTLNFKVLQPILSAAVDLWARQGLVAGQLFVCLSLSSLCDEIT